ncbi:MAG TPA: ribonuclease J [Thermoanaerobaculia bacterium]|nr:ribonuclease J [Thermoanaerobaculia bacterium]
MTESLELTHLGGLGEFGKNCLVIRAGGRAIVVDAGISFGDELLPGIGVDRVAPDFSPLARDRVAGVFLTHGHEDHIGALSFLRRTVDAPVFATPFTAALAGRRVSEEGADVDIRAVSWREPVEAGGFAVTFFPVSHSVPQSAALLIEVAGRKIFHTGDFKFDPDSPFGEGTDLDAIAARAGGCDLLLLDSTNAERDGGCPSEREAREGLERLIAEGAPGRIVLTTFSSHVARIGAAAAAAREAGRKVAIVGRSMAEIAELGERHGYLSIPAGAAAGRDTLAQLAPRRAFVLCAGSQAEPNSALARLSAGALPDLRFSRGDRVLFSARTIPGREAAVARVVDDFLRGGASVVRDAAHVSGHAYAGDLELLIAALAPRAALPVHGRREALEHGAAAARRAGVPAERVFVLENGDSLFAGESFRVERGARPAEVVWLDGASAMAIGPDVLRDRRQLAAAGFVTVVVAAATRKVLDVSFRGVSAPEDGGAAVALEVEAALDRASRAEAADREWIRREASAAAKRACRRRWGVRPLVAAVVVARA